METAEISALRRLMDKDQIRDVLMRYSRAMDRRDRALAASIYWPDAIDDHILYSGDVPGFLDFSFGFMVDMPTMHFLGNMMIDLLGPNEAFCETYVVAYHDMPRDGGREDLMFWGRYLDRMEKRDGEWRIQSRTLTLDAYSLNPGTAVWDKGMFQNLQSRGAAKPNDLLYRLHPKGRDL